MSPAILVPRPKILFLDAYDSFSNNIVALIEQNAKIDVVKIFIDDPLFANSHVPGNYAASVAFLAFLKRFSAVIAGPGPGWAKCDKDVGLMKFLWMLEDEHLLPVLGICLGFQSLCYAFGADIERLQQPKHGIISEVLHNGQSIFRDLNKLSATQYHSLQVKLNHPIQTNRAVRNPMQLWEPAESCPQLEPLAWDFHCNPNGAVLMGVKHISKPFWGVQFHPESICTNDQGKHVVQNWWKDVEMWNHECRLSSSSTLSLPSPTDGIALHGTKQRSLSITKATSTLHSDVISPKELALLIAHGDGQVLPDLPPSIVHCATLGSGRLTVSDVCEVLDIPRHEAIVLQSGLQTNLVPMTVGTGRYSIVGLVIPNETLRLHYYAGSRTMQLRDGNDMVHTEWTGANPWSYLREAMKGLQPSTPPQTATWAPFWGGLMGYVSYEAGLETIGVSVDEDALHPDICFAYITRSIVFDHQLKKMYIQSIRGEADNQWVKDIRNLMYEAAGYKSLESTPSSTPMPQPNPLDPNSSVNHYLESCTWISTDGTTYGEKVSSCQSAIADGQSYELCLTTRHEIRATKPATCRSSQSETNEHSWNLYKHLAEGNPAPFSAYMRMHNVHILSSSPERYMCWDRSQTAQCRPIKGTVQKKPGVDADMAHAILSLSKERAENLMIVDLTRHQLHGVYGSNNVHVSQLMEVEEYETLWQLVSVVDAVSKGAKASGDEEWEDPVHQVTGLDELHSRNLGFQAFVESLPPGSMTGAPKKRSCEILQKEEDGVRRGIYSGVLGYLDVGGAGDFSVVIRTAVKVDDPGEEEEDVWYIGAGGAVTSQSEPQAEYEEMKAKFQSTARAFMKPPIKKSTRKRKDMIVIEQENPEFAALLANMRGGEEMSLDDAQLMLRVVERELRRAASEESDRDAATS